MPQITVNTTNIENFGFDVLFSPYAQTVKFDTAALTTYNDPSGSGALYVLGISFSLIDSQGVVLAEVDWDNPQIMPSEGETEYTLDLSSVGIDFFFQTYKIIGYIKDADGQIYSTTPVSKKICQPVDITSGGYINGIFQVLANCPDNVLTVKEVTPFTYNNQAPDTITKTGNLYYPTGTLSAVAFTGTPFTNNSIYTGQYRIICTTTCNYNFGDDVYVDLVYYTNNVFDLTCSNKVQDILCCLVDLQRTKTANCNNAIGERAAQQLSNIEIPFFIAVSKEISGQDASEQVAFIRKQLNCNCGGNSIIRNEFSPLNNEPNPIDPTVTTIIIQGVGGTSVASPTVNGNTKTFNIQSNVYQVVKGDTGDTAYSITIDTSVANTVKYKIAFNYAVLAQTLLTNIGSTPSLLTQFNSLVNITNFNIDLSNLDGKCVIDLTANSFFLSQKVPSAASQILNIIINGTTYNAPGGSIVVSDISAIELWLNGLGLGSFDVSFSNAISGAYINILTVANSNTVTSCRFGISSTSPSVDDSFVTTVFQATNKSLIAFLQAVVDYMCALSDLDVVLSQSQGWTYIDYNGDTITETFPSGTTQEVFNAAVANVISTIQNLNTSFESGLTRTLNVVRLGGTLQQATVITLNGQYFRFYKDANHYSTFAELYTQFYNAVGSGGTDMVLRVGWNQDVATFVAATNNDIAAISYLAPSILQADAANKNAVLGAYYPYTDNANVSPAPSNDPDKTAYVIAQEGRVDYYAKDHVFEGTKMSVGSLLKVKNMTTAERNAIDAGLLEAGLIIFNTTSVKFQGYDGSTWNDLG